MVFALDLASLSLPPVDCGGRGLVQTGKDVLRCWPHEYSSMAENALWTGGLNEAEWAQVQPLPGSKDPLEGDHQVLSHLGGWAGARAAHAAAEMPDFDEPGSSSQPPMPSFT